MPTFYGLGDEQLWLCPSLEDSETDLSSSSRPFSYQNGLNTTADSTYGGSRAYDFDGADDYIYFYDNGINGGGGFADFMTSDNWSVSFFAKCGNAAGSARDPFLGGRSRSGYSGVSFWNNFDNPLDFQMMLFDSGSQVRVSWNDDPAVDTDWHHFCWYAENGTIFFAVDGVTSSLTYSQSTLPDPSIMTSFYIGRAHNFSYFLGLQDDIRLYSRTLSQDEISYLSSARGVLGSVGGTSTLSLLGVG